MGSTSPTSSTTTNSTSPAPTCAPRTRPYDEVALLASPAVLVSNNGGNLVIVASQPPLNLDAMLASAGQRGLQWSALLDDKLATWDVGAAVLTDDYAPADQLLTPYSRESPSPA